MQRTNWFDSIKIVLLSAAPNQHAPQRLPSRRLLPSDRKHAFSREPELIKTRHCSSRRSILLQISNVKQPFK